jgi:hypothetical protein
VIPSVAATLLVASWMGAAGDPYAVGMRVRAEASEVRTLIATATARSGTVRELIARLNCTDAIVYVEVIASPLVPTARTKLVATVAGARFIRISINIAVGDRDRMPLLAHELQHAVEIAEQFDVRDDDGVRRLYAKIGRSTGRDSFETDAARDVEWIVRTELHTKIGG